MIRVTELDKHIGAKVRVRRCEVGLTQRQLAELIGVTYQQEHKYESGVNRISAVRLYRIAQALGTDMNYFFDGTGAAIPELELRRLLDLTSGYQKLAPEHQQAVITLINDLLPGSVPESDVPQAA